jgi:long-chain acyl-CoA synthetase
MNQVLAALNPAEVMDLAGKGMLSSLYARLKPDAIAIHAPRGTRTFRALHENANRVSAMLRAAGIGPGDHIALICPNTPEFIEVLAGNQRTGTRLTPINWHLSAPEAAYIVGDCTAKALVAHADFAEAALASVNPNLKLKLAIGGPIEGFDDYAQALAAQSPADPPEPTHGGTMMYTSGTTGRPKGVWRPRTIVLPPQWGEGTQKGYDPDVDVNLCCGPAYHAAPLAFDIAQPLAAGVPIALMEKFDPEACLAMIEQYRVTHVHMVATMFQRILALPEAVRTKYDLSSLRFILHGAAPTPPEVKHAMMRWLGPILYEYYAASEGGGNFFITPDEWLRKPGSVGWLDPSFGTRIVGDDGADLPVGEVGQIYFPHSAVARFEYFNDKTKTAAAELPGGTHFTVGDMGYVDEDGYLFLTGRTAECIISGGVNIYPQEIDNEIIKHPAVEDSCAIGVPDAEWGEQVKVVVTLRPGEAASEALAGEILAFARQRLAGFKIPKSLDFAEDLPRTPAGKIQRGKVRAPFWEGRARQI